MGNKIIFSVFDKIQGKPLMINLLSLSSLFGISSKVMQGSYYYNISQTFFFINLRFSTALVFKYKRKVWMYIYFQVKWKALHTTLQSNICKLPNEKFNTKELDKRRIYSPLSYTYSVTDLFVKETSSLSIKDSPVINEKSVLNKVGPRFLNARSSSCGIPVILFLIKEMNIVQRDH